MTRNLTTAKVSDLHSAGNVRREVGDVRELAYSIDRVGILNPLTVRQNGDGFELIAGHRRLAAAEKIGLETVPVYVLEATDEADEDGPTGWRIALQLIENVQREDLDALEEADALADLVELLGSQKVAAEAIGRSQAHVSKRLKLRQLPDLARDLIAHGDVSLEDAFELTKIDDPDKANEAARKLADGSRWELDRAVQAADRDAKSRKAARDVAKQSHRQDVTVVALPDIEKSWKTLDGWDGLPVDQDAHEAEPCHRLVVGFHQWDTEPREAFYCADPARHDPEKGESEVKTFKTDRETNAEKAAAQAAETRRHNEEVRARLFGEALAVASNLSDRNTALKVLGRFLLETLDKASLGDYLAALGDPLPEEPDGDRWDNDETRAAWTAWEAAVAAHLDGLSVATTYRAAVLYVLDSTALSPVAWYREKSEAAAVAALLDIRIPDPDTDE